MLDWDSHRYHECYFAVPMMGAVGRASPAKVASLLTAAMHAPLPLWVLTTDPFRAGVDQCPLLPR